MQYLVECVVILVTPGMCIFLGAFIAERHRRRREDRHVARMEYDQLRRFLFYRG